MRISRFLLGLTAAVLLAQTAAPQAGPRLGAQGRPAIQALQSAIGLSDQQVQQMVQLRKDERQALQSVRQQAREKREALQAARQSANPDPATVGQLVLDLQKLTEQLQSANQDYHNRALAVLDATQQGKLQDLQKSAPGTAGDRRVLMAARALNLILPLQRMRGRRMGN